MPRSALGGACRVPGCGARCTFGKPFCEEHVEHMPAAAAIAAVERRRVTEELAAGRGQPPPADGPLARDVLAALTWLGGGPLGAGVLGREAGFRNERGLEAVGRALEAVGKIRVGRTERGSVTLELVDKPPIDVEVLDLEPACKPAPQGSITPPATSPAAEVEKDEPAIAPAPATPVKEPAEPEKDEVEVVKQKTGGRPRGEWVALKPEDIVKWREEHDVSVGKLAEALGVSPTSVKNWETDAVVATLEKQTEIAALLELDGLEGTAPAPKKKAAAPRPVGPRPAVSKALTETNGNGTHAPADRDVKPANVPDLVGLLGIDFEGMGRLLAAALLRQLAAQLEQAAAAVERGE